MLHKKMSRTDYIVEGILLLIGIMTCICILYPIVNILAVSLSSDAVSYTHLDVYKRQLYYMFCIDPFVIVFIAGPLIGNFVFGRLINEVKFRMNKECVPYNRRMDYVNRTLYLADYAKELRMSEIFQVLKKIYEEGFQGVLGKIREYRDRKVLLVFLRNIFTFVVIFQGVIFYSLYRVLGTHSMSLSGFTVLFSAMTAVAWMVIQASQAIIQSYEDSLYIANPVSYTHLDVYKRQS